jgi:ornithine carbamoyltransferase
LVTGRYERAQGAGLLTGIKARIAAGHTFAVVKSGFLTPAQRLSSSEPLAAGDILATFAAARRLRADARAGTIGKPLRGKNLALLLDAPPGGEPSVLHRAALELGARVAEVRFTDPTGSASAWDEIRALARMLGRMYDAVDCATLAPATVRRIEQEAGVPIYEGLGLDDHPARALADLMTLCDHGSAPASEASILFLGDPWTTRARAFLAAAREIGIEVRVGTRARAASSDATFVVDATRTPHWSLRAQTSPLDEARRSENHRCVMQTVLLDTIVKA